MPKPPSTRPIAPVPLDDATLDAVIGGATIVPPDAGSGSDPLTGGYVGSEPPAPPPPGSPPLIPDMG